MLSKEPQPPNAARPAYASQDPHPSCRLCSDQQGALVKHTRKCPGGSPGPTSQLRAGLSLQWAPGAALSRVRIKAQETWTVQGERPCVIKAGETRWWKHILIEHEAYTITQILQVTAATLQERKAALKEDTQYRELVFNVYRLNSTARDTRGTQARRECSLGDADHAAGQAAPGIAGLLALVVAPFAQVIALLVDLGNGEQTRPSVVTSPGSSPRPAQRPQEPAAPDGTRHRDPPGRETGT